ncbi:MULTISPECIES: helix-turn-helix domain-containing protein [Paenibacillaceae]|jgi:transcriptional regulator with XRE-family HTH domain|uniref:Helix-turn-helix transcriptional regulator n=1 Tax=Paenibacillus hemerocallicola TaxID=1172614 RepID=A0A5C4T895_9BACL|nr:helix-turn-helix transcriptional regulator [Paenibacillus hemerocallicola]TNJ65314.1 helix-turn-helix transcriptional regulator [Paenibacillus hemerocallicola]
MVTFAQTVGAKIRLHRMAQNLTQDKLGELIGMAGSYLAQIERGEINVKLQTIEKIASGLHMSVHDLFGDQAGSLQENRWIWESVLLLLQQDEAKQRQAHRILKALLTEEESS